MQKPTKYPNQKDSATKPSQSTGRKVSPGAAGGSDTGEDEIHTGHWADNAANELIALHPDKPEFVCASGISPSGFVHIGNFREVITVDLVARALQSKGKKVRFLYSWDDYDAFRKVPANLPNQAALNAHLRKPISDVPDPFGTAPAYAAHFERKFEASIEQLGIRPGYIYQNQAYRSCQYRDGIRTALENQDKIVEILNQFRTEPLPKEWWCVTVYSEATGKDATEILGYEPPYTIRYRCEETNREFTTDFSKEGRVKLLWRIDWPMRWAYEQVDFEPGGKDHSSQGGSYETGKHIIRQVWKREAPFYVQYDFVLAKGLGAKLSSSSGNLITLDEALEVYEPHLIRWIFASRKPNLDFTIAFDLDVMKAYDDFDRCERFAYGLEEGEPKKVGYETRIFELACVSPVDTKKPMPPQFGFRHLCNILQIYEGEMRKVEEYFAESLNQPGARERLLSRAGRAWKWIQTYAPEAFRFRIRDDKMAPFKTKKPEALRKVIHILESWDRPSSEEQALTDSLRTVMQEEALDAKSFFPEVYGALIGKANGPKLATFVLTIGPKRAAEILKAAL